MNKPYLKREAKPWECPVCGDWECFSAEIEHICTQHVDVSGSCSICETQRNLCKFCRSDVRMVGGRGHSGKSKTAICNRCLKGLKE